MSYLASRAFGGGSRLSQLSLSLSLSPLLWDSVVKRISLPDLDGLMMRVCEWPKRSVLRLLPIEGGRNRDLVNPYIYRPLHARVHVLQWGRKKGFLTFDILT